MSEEGGNRVRLRGISGFRVIGAATTTVARVRLGRNLAHAGNTNARAPPRCKADQKMANIRRGSRDRLFLGAEPRAAMGLDASA